MRDFGLLPESSTHNLTRPEPENPRKRQSRSAREIAGWCDEVIADAVLLKTHLAQATGRGLADSVGVSSSNGEKVGGTKDPDAAMLRLVEQDDPARRQLAFMVKGAENARGGMKMARAAMLALLPMDPTKAKFMLGEGPSQCLNCGRDVWNTPADRLRRGRCEPCFRYLQRHEVERPEHLWNPQSPQTEDRSQPAV